MTGRTDLAMALMAIVLALGCAWTARHHGANRVLWPADAGSGGLSGKGKSVRDLTDAEIDRLVTYLTVLRQGRRSR